MLDMENKLSVWSCGNILCAPEVEIQVVTDFHYPARQNAIYRISCCHCLRSTTTFENKQRTQAAWLSIIQDINQITNPPTQKEPTP